MLAFIALSFITCLMLRDLMPLTWAELALPFQKACLSHLPKSVHRDAYAAIVCGARLPAGSLKNDLRVTGLLHIMIVSGSHLLFLEQALSFASKASIRIRILIFPLLAIFALASGLQMPAIRALISLGCKALNRRWNLGWSLVQTITVSGFVSLNFCRSPSEILSLLLSWCAALALAAFASSRAAPENHRPTLCARLWDTFLRQGFVYICLTPLLVSFAPAHPASILSNWLLGPLLGFVLFPLSLVAVLIHPVSLAGDVAWSVTTRLLALAAAAIPEAPASLEVSRGWPWLHIAAITVLLLAAERSRLPKARSAERRHVKSSVPREKERTQ